MALRIAINGYGRIGRCFLRALVVSPLRSKFTVVAINEPADLESMAYLTRFDSTHGCFPGVVEVGDGCLRIDGADIPVFHVSTPGGVDWASLGVDLLIEASGQYSCRHELEAFLDAGCCRVLLSHPGLSAADVDQTIVFGMNHHLLKGDERIVSAASCTTNAIVPAMESMIPVSTGLARGVVRLLPELAGRVEAKAIRVPVVNVSAIDLVVTLCRQTSVEEVNALLSAAADGHDSGRMSYTAAPHASIDFNHSVHSAIVDAGQTRMSGGRLLNLLIWFDNEWGFANRMLDVAAFWGERMR